MKIKPINAFPYAYPRAGTIASTRATKITRERVGLTNKSIKLLLKSYIAMFYRVKACLITWKIKMVHDANSGLSAKNVIKANQTDCAEQPVLASLT